MRISYSDSEVHTFHPVCEQALTRALRLMGQEDVYAVVHHRYTGSLEMDYCVQNKKTGRYLCVVEVKRTPSDVQSLRYQYQAMSYVQMNAGNNEKPFYILTNLECAIAFRYEEKRPRVYQQMLAPGVVTVGNFEEHSQEELTKRLAQYFQSALSDFISDSYTYLVILEKFAGHMEQIKDSPRRWKSELAILLYEYIRGSFDSAGRRELKDVRLFQGSVEKICREGARINFKDIFAYTPDLFLSEAKAGGDLLASMYDLGEQNITGDAVAGVLHQVVSAGHEHEGEVSTDPELGRFVAELAKYVSGGLQAGELICDPAAGSGSLLSSAIGTFALTPDQILANDSNPRLLELLSLRLGLNFAKNICRTCSPKVENRNLADLKKAFFAHVKVIVMNPPFVAGINCVRRKQPLFDRIRELTGKDPISEFGQMPLEGVFLELLTHLVPAGTTIASVFPKTHLMARGPEAQRIRTLIVENLGIHTVFLYPGNELFDDVTKDTCILVGKAMQPANFVGIVSSYENIPDLDTHRFMQAVQQDFSDEFSPIMPGVAAKRIALADFRAGIADGWRERNSEIAEAVVFVRDRLKASGRLFPLSRFHFQCRRGTAGNSGASDLLFLDSREELYKKYCDRAGLHLEPAMRNAKLDRFDIGGGDARFLAAQCSEESLVEEILDDYLRLPARGGKQRRKTKSREELKKILWREGRGKFTGPAVLIPRNIRRAGRIYLSHGAVYVSTNFLVFELPDEDRALLLSTWMTTIFYQVICEVSAKDQEGARKMETGDILATLAPDINDPPCALVSKLRMIKDRIKFADLQNPQIREVDQIWAEELFGSGAKEMLQSAQRLLGYLANRRNT